MKPSDDPEQWDPEVLEHLRDDIIRQDAAAQTGLQQLHDHALSMFRICFIVIGFPVTAIGLFGGDIVAVSSETQTCLTTPLSWCVSFQATIIIAFVLLFLGMVLFLATAGLTSATFFQSVSGPTARLYLFKDEQEYLVNYVSDFVGIVEERDLFPFALYGLLYTGFASVLAAILLVSVAGYVVFFDTQLPAIVGLLLLAIVSAPFLVLLLFVSERRLQRWRGWLERWTSHHRPEPIRRPPRRSDAGDQTETPSDETPSEDT